MINVTVSVTGTASIMATIDLVTIRQRGTPQRRRHGYIASYGKSRGPVRVQ